MGKHRKNPNRPAPNYPVGYCKPPEHSQFKTGQRSPRAGKSGSKTLAAEANRLLLDKLKVTESGVPRRIPARTFILMALRAKALKGDLKTADYLFRLAAGDEIEFDAIEAELTDEDRAMLEDYLRRSDQLESSGGSSDPSSLNPSSPEPEPNDED